mmetsp:Transcript_39115/g.121951  ORF Transcript_39115/g.121951 Transcript_39115/m.121951 type:complete len:214 (-) Transcript_39115:256-897(-)
MCRRSASTSGGRSGCSGARCGAAGTLTSTWRHLPSAQTAPSGPAGTPRPPATSAGRRGALSTPSRVRCASPRPRHARFTWPEASTAATAAFSSTTAASSRCSSPFGMIQGPTAGSRTCVSATAPLLSPSAGRAGAWVHTAAAGLASRPITAWRTGRPGRCTRSWCARTQPAAAPSLHAPCTSPARAGWTSLGTCAPRSKEATCTASSEVSTAS